LSPFVPDTVRAVVEAYGKVEAVEVVAVKYAPTTCPTTESLAYGEVVPMPKLPLAARVMRVAGPFSNVNNFLFEIAESVLFKGSVGFVAWYVLNRINPKFDESDASLVESVSPVKLNDHNELLVLL
jgi:hypothetical protein